MKKQFNDVVRSLGGHTKYSGGTEQPEMTEKTQHRRVLTNYHRYGGHLAVKSTLTIGHYAAKRLVKMKSSEGRTMYVHGLGEENALKLQDKFKGIALPFQVVFQ